MDTCLVDGQVTDPKKTLLHQPHTLLLPTLTTEYLTRLTVHTNHPLYWLNTSSMYGSGSTLRLRLPTAPPHYSIHIGGYPTRCIIPRMVSTPLHSPTIHNTPNAVSHRCATAQTCICLRWLQNSPTLYCLCQHPLQLMPPADAPSVDCITDSPVYSLHIKLLPYLGRPATLQRASPALDLAFSSNPQYVSLRIFGPSDEHTAPASSTSLLAIPDSSPHPFSFSPHTPGIEHAAKHDNTMSLPPAFRLRTPQAHGSASRRGGSPCTNVQ